MIDHVSIGVRDLAASDAFYGTVLATIGYERLVERDGTVGFGKRYPDFWINARPNEARDTDSGLHVCFRTREMAAVDAFHAAAIAAGGSDDGAPGLRPIYSETYYAAFVRDPEGNRIEAVTFLSEEG